MSTSPALILVTGATGFLGGATLRYLMSGDAPVFASVRSGHLDLADVGVAGWVVVDLASADAALRLRAVLPDRPIHLVHLAADCRSSSPDALFRANVEATLSLLEALAGRLAHVTYASSVAVFGSYRQVRDGGGYQVAPDTAYGRGKWLAECALDLFGKATGVPVAVLRLASLYGPGNPHRNAIGALTTAVAEGRPYLIGPAERLFGRDYLHVADAARAVAAACRTGYDGIAEVGSGVAASPYDLVDLLTAAGETVQAVDRAVGTPIDRFACDPAPARKLLGQAPVGLRRGVVEELAWRRVRPHDGRAEA
jgi:nucleoside-diphosphate-sugar epimerase